MGNEIVGCNLGFIHSIISVVWLTGNIFLSSQMLSMSIKFRKIIFLYILIQCRVPEGAGSQTYPSSLVFGVSMNIRDLLQRKTNKIVYVFVRLGSLKTPIMWLRPLGWTMTMTNILSLVRSDSKLLSSHTKLQQSWSLPAMQCPSVFLVPQHKAYRCMESETCCKFSAWWNTQRIIIHVITSITGL